MDFSCFAFASPSDPLLVRAGGLAAPFFGRTASRSRPVLVFVAAVHLVSSRLVFPLGKLLPAS
jgi:hypothetical protein